ncbi:MAG: methionine--tRNA ligase [Candidatus Harrisonbacteria bacterium]|nr:methionine--tRNA ligase [Candidatus Harrisonbacteria bacterium]
MAKKFYITTSIPYVNAAPHLGSALDSLYADVLARFNRARGRDVRFLTGTDEHGVKIARAAALSKRAPQGFADANSAKFRGLREALNLSWDDFIRTSDKARHYPGAQKLWRALAAKGDVYKKAYRGLYCVGHEAFVTEKDLENGVCRDHQKKPEVIEEENWFFRLSAYGAAIAGKIASGELRIVPSSRANEILSLIREGLQDVSFSRPRKDLSWGVPVPDDDTQTMYVWADALANYISALGYGSADETLFKTYWPADVQVIGKDNLRFHAAIWAGMLLSAGLPLPRALFVHGFLNVEGQKISKSLGNVIDPYALVKKFGIDPVRYYLLREIVPAEDGDWAEQKFVERYNADLANGLGNFASRVLTLAEKHGVFSDGGVRDLAPEVGEAIEHAKVDVAVALEEFRFNEALAGLWRLISAGDKYVNDRKPWAEKDNTETLVNAVTLLDNVAAMLSPFLPQTAKKITDSIQWGERGAFSVRRIAALFPRR